MVPVYTTHYLSQSYCLFHGSILAVAYQIASHKTNYMNQLILEYLNGCNADLQIGNMNNILGIKYQPTYRLCKTSTCYCVIY